MGHEGQHAMAGTKSDKLELQTLLSADESEGERKSLEMNDSENLGRGEENYELWKNAAICISCISIIFTTGFGVTFFVISQLAGSPAAFGFAFAAVLDSFSSVVVLWRFCGADSQDSAEKERRACIAIGVCFILSAFAIASRAVYALVLENVPGMEYTMELLSVASLLSLIFLVLSKCLIAHKVHSRTMKTDAINSLAGAVMTLGMIASDVVCETNPKICYLDSATAILIAIALLSYGVMTIVEMMPQTEKNKPTNDLHD